MLKNRAGKTPRQFQANASHPTLIQEKVSIRTYSQSGDLFTTFQQVRNNALHCGSFEYPIKCHFGIRIKTRILYPNAMDLIIERLDLSFAS